MARHNKEMTTETKQMILRLKREGYAHRKIAEIIGRDHSTITKFLKRYDERNSVENKPKTGRKKLVTERSVKVNRRETLIDLTNIVNERLPRPVSTRTVRRRLKFHGYTRRRVRKTLTVSLKKRKNRVNWCRGKLAMSVQLYWKRNILRWNTSSCWSWHASACLEKGWRNLATWMCWFEGWPPCSSDVLGMHYLW